MDEFQNNISSEENNNNVQTLPDYGQAVNVNRGVFKIFGLTVANMVLLIINVIAAIISIISFHTIEYCMAFAVMLPVSVFLIKLSVNNLLSGILGLLFHLAVLAFFIFIFFVMLVY